MTEIRIRADEECEDGVRGPDSATWGLYSSCQANQIYYEARKMKAEAYVFQAYMRKLEEKFGMESDWRITR